MKTEFSTTSVKKGRNGWEAETIVNIENGCDYSITTSKRYGGSVSCSAQSGTSGESSGFTSFKFMMFSDPSYNLASKKVRASEKSITEIHLAGLENFKQKLEAGELVTEVENVD